MSTPSGATDVHPGPPPSLHTNILKSPTRPLQSSTDLFSDGLGPMWGSRSGYRRRGEEVHLEFSVSDGKDKVDQPPGGGSYRLTQPGGYKLQSGKLRPFARAIEAPIMLVRPPAAP